MVVVRNQVKNGGMQHTPNNSDDRVPLHVGHRHFLDLRPQSAIIDDMSEGKKDSPDTK